MIYGHDGRRYVSRPGAGFKGTISNWITKTINSRLAEYEKGVLSNRAWDLYSGNPDVYGLLEGLLTDVVGIGITPTYRPLVDIPEDFSVPLMKGWARWAYGIRNHCDITRRLNFYGLQMVSYFLWKIDGACFAYITRKPTARGRSTDLTVQLIESYRVKTPADLMNDKSIIDGVEIDKYGEPTYIWVAKTEGISHNTKTMDRLKVYNDTLDMPQVLFITDVRNLSEYKQESLISCMMKSLRDMEDAVDATVVKYVLSNLLVFFLKSDTDMSGAEPDNYDLYENIYEFDKGTMIKGPGGAEPVMMKGSGEPGPEFDRLYNTVISRLGTATNRGAETIKRDFKSSYSASRANIEVSERFNSSDRQLIVDKFSKPVFSWFLLDTILSGRGSIGVPLDEVLDDIDVIANCNWNPQPEIQIDRLKQRNAEGKALDNNTTTYEGIYSQYNRDWRVELEQRAKEKRVIKQLEEKYGVSLDTDAPEQGVIDDDDED